MDPLSSVPFPAPRPPSYLEATARQRLAGLLDPGSFAEWLGPASRETSPHLPRLDLPVAFDDGIVVGRGTLEGRPVFVAAQEGQFMGGSLGEVHAAKLLGLLRRAAAAPAPTAVAVLLLLDTGGVRLQEANAGELGAAEIIRTLLAVRARGTPVVGLVGGRGGCFGAGGLIAACCGHLVVSEDARIGLSGPEVIETNRGVEEFDARDRALVWRTVGGKHRYLLGAAGAFVDDALPAFRAAAVAALTAAAPAAGAGTPERSAATFDLAGWEAEHDRLERRLAVGGPQPDSYALWRALGMSNPEEVPGWPTAVFLDQARKHARR